MIRPGFRVAALMYAFIAVAATLSPRDARAELSVTPITWNIVGLDSNSPATGPRRFPVGARVCSDVATSDVLVQFERQSSNANINLRPGSLSQFTVPSLAVGACSDAYFEAEITPVAAAFHTTRRYRILATDATGTVSTPVPRELYVERLISQQRNSITNIRYGTTPGNLVSVASGAQMNLVVGNTYLIELIGGTATQGYEQFAAFINFPNTIFQILSVSTTYSANSSIYVSNPNDTLYADACLWENDPNSPNYRACVGVRGKAGGSNVVTTYTIRVIGGGGTSQVLNTLLYDFSGASFHYNGDYTSGARIANVIDPASTGIAKSFMPATTSAGGISRLTFTLTNPNAAALGGYNFVDNLPAGLVVANPPMVSTNGCGTPTFGPVAGASSITFTNGTVAGGGSCAAAVNVTAATAGNYPNVSNNLFIGTVDTGQSASATLTVNNAPPPPACTPGIELARWTMNPAQGTTTPPAFSFKAANVATANASFTPRSSLPGVQSINTAEGQPVNSWSGTGWNSDGEGVPTASTASYFDFELDTSNYSSNPAQPVRITFSVNPISGWANPSNNSVYVYSSVNGGPFSTILTNDALVRQTWNTGLTAVAHATGTTTRFRINAKGRSNGTPTAPLLLDNIIVTGCGVPSHPTLIKAFAPNPIAVGGVSTLTFTLSNPNGIALTGAAFTDTLPAGMVVATPPAAATTCGGSPTWTPAAGASTLNFGTLNGASIPANGSCTVQVNVTTSTVGPSSNVSGFISTTQTGQNTSPTGSAAATLTAIAPPSIAKLFTSNPVQQGAISTLTFTLVNPNQNNALTGVAFADSFPTSPSAMVVANPAHATTSGCGSPVFAPTSGAGAIAFSGGTIAAGGTCVVTVNVTAPIAGTYANISGPVSHVINAVAFNGNTAAATLTMTPPNPGLALLKQAGPTALGEWLPYLALASGDDVFYLLTVENTGDVPLAPVSVIDPLVDTSGCAWPNPLPVADAQDDDHIATCVIGPITAALGITVNTATANGAYPGGNVGDQASAAYATTGLSLIKTASPLVYDDAGDSITYSFEVGNTGSAILSGPVVIDDDLTDDETCPPLSTIGNGDNFFDPGETIVCTASYVITAGDIAAGAVINTAQASTGEATSPEASVTVIANRPSLAVEKAAAPTVFVVGQSASYAITVRNDGAAPTSDAIVITDTLPAGIVLDSFAGSGWNCVGSNAVTCTFPGTLPASEQTVLVLNVTVNPGAVNGDNIAIASGGGDDDCPAVPRCSGSVTVPVTAIADLAILKTVDQTTPAVGDTVVFTVSVVNNGPSDASGVVVSDSLPSGYSFVSATASVGSYSDSTGVWTIGALANGANATLTLTATVNAAGDYLNVASISGNEPDPVPGNDDDSAVTRPLQTAIIGLAKAAGPVSAAGVGRWQVQFTFTVANYGDVPLTNVQIRDDLTSTFPAPATFEVGPVSASGNLTANVGFDGGADTALLQAVASSLAVGAVETVQVTVSFRPNGAIGPFMNTAVASGTGPDGTGISDVSNNGNDPDPNDDGNPDENAQTPIVVPQGPPPAAPATPVPTLGIWAILILLTLILCCAAGPVRCRLQP